MRLIDADALLEETKRYVYQSDMVTTVAIGIAETWIKDAPTVEAKPMKKGRWVTYPECLAYDGAYSDTHMVCSKCEHVWDYMDNDAETFNYCPNCGEMMVQQDNQ